MSVLWVVNNLMSDNKERTLSSNSTKRKQTESRGVDLSRKWIEH